MTAPILPENPAASTLSASNLRQDTIRNLLPRMNRVSIGLAVLLLSVVIIVQQMVGLHYMAASEFRAQTRIVGNNCRAAIAFGDIQAAKDILSSLENVQNVIEGEIVSVDESFVASYHHAGASPSGQNEKSRVALQPRIIITLQTIEVVEAIILRGKLLGHVRLLYDTTPMIFRLVLMVLELILLGFVTTVLASYLFSRRLDAISQPMVHLVETMQAITRDKDYSRRVPLAGPAEVSDIAAGFNELLHTTENWSKEILVHRENLERLVEIRTKQLQKANQSLEAELEERCRTEQELRLRTDELAKVSENLSKALEFEKRFLANISHEIRTPLNAIIGFSNLALQTQMSTRQYEFVSKIQTAGGSLLGIIDDLLDFSKIEAGKLELEHVPFNLDELVDEALDIVSPMIRKKELNFTLEIAPEVPADFSGPSLRLRQILINLLGNAVKFTEVGEISLRVEVAEQTPERSPEQSSERSSERTKLVFTVRDTGIGITAEQKSRLFTPFTQADGSMTRRFGGTGLGLSISKHLIEMMDGEIDVESELQKGSVFRFSVWLTPVSLPPRIHSASDSVLHGLHGILIDDHGSTHPSLTRSLRPFSLRLELPRSEAGAREIIQTGDGPDPIRLVLLDVEQVKPEMGDLISWLRTDQSIQHHPEVIAVIPSAKPGLRDELNRLGASVVLSRPLTRSTLFDAVIQVFAPQELAALRRGKTAWQGESSFEGFHALIVEDNEFNMEIAQELLQSWGFKTHSAVSGLQAVEAVAAHPPETFDLILMDLQMPELDGFEATKHIRRHPHGVAIPILAMTANAFADVRARAIAAGMDDFVVKPINPVELREKVSARLQADKRCQMPALPLAPLSPLAPLVSSGFPDIDGIDVKSALARMSGNAVKFSQLLIRFLDRLDSIRHDLAAALAAKDFPKMGFLSHSLKGSAGNCGMNDVQEMALNLEKAAQTQEEALVDHWFRQLGFSLDHLKTAISGARDRLIRLQAAGNPSAVEPKELTREVLEQLQSLKQDLISHRFESVEKLEGIRAQWSSALAVFPAFHELCGAMTRFAFPKAREQLDELCRLIEERLRQSAASPHSRNQE
jgi:two-component system sensor histidine kinase/response regulator